MVMKRATGIAVYSWTNDTAGVDFQPYDAGFFARIP